MLNILRLQLENVRREREFVASLFDKDFFRHLDATLTGVCHHGRSGRGSRLEIALESVDCDDDRVPGFQGNAFTGGQGGRRVSENTELQLSRARIENATKPDVSRVPRRADDRARRARRAEAAGAGAPCAIIEVAPVPIRRRCRRRESPDLAVGLRRRNDHAVGVLADG